jgi:hypothetical protein
MAEPEFFFPIVLGAENLHAGFRLSYYFNSTVDPIRTIPVLFGFPEENLEKDQGEEI